MLYPRLSRSYPIIAVSVRAIYDSIQRLEREIIRFYPTDSEQAGFAGNTVSPWYGVFPTRILPEPE
jgi:hypothetical protein